MILKIKKFMEVKLPSTYLKGDAGLDLYLPEDFTIKPFETSCISLGIGFEIPEEYAGHIIPRSSLAKKGLIMQMEAIDSNYRGEVHLIITNCSINTYEFHKDDRLCSLILIPSIISLKEVEIKEVENLSDSVRGSAGLGSSGK